MIIFDLDGTLWDTTESLYEAANDITNKYSDINQISIETVKKGMGLSSEENARNFMPYLDDEKALYYLKKIGKRSIEIINEKGAILYDGVIDTIHKLSKKHKLGIVTNNTDEYVKTFLKVSKLEKYFSDYIGAASYNITKKDAIKNITSRNNEPNSIYVGDIKKDMIAAEEAKVTFIHAKYGFEPTLESKYYIDNIKKLEELLNKIFD